MKEFNYKRFCWQYKHLYEKVNPHTIRNILDVGCGDGELVISFAKMFPKANVIGIDKYGRYKESNERRAKAEKMIVDYELSKRCRIEQANALNLSFPDASFDLIHVRNALHHMFNSFDADSSGKIVSFFKKIEALLNKKGFLIISEIGPVNYISYLKYILPQWLIYIPQAHNMDYNSKLAHQEWMDCLKKAGFNIIFLDHYSPYRLRYLRKILSSEFSSRFFYSAYTILAQSH